MGVVPPSSTQELYATSAELAAATQPIEIATEHERRVSLERGGWIALVLLAPATLAYLSFKAGGYFPSANGLVAIVLAQALLLRTTFAARPFEGFSRALAVPLVALALYAAWQLLSVSWAHATARALDSYDRTLVYLLALALFGSLRYTPARLQWLLRAVFAGLAVVCLIGLVSRVLPHAWPTSASFYSSRLSFPLTYWNAEGMLAATAVILGLHLSASRTEPWAVRVLAAALLPAIAVTLLLTFSRGALGVAGVGLVAYCLLTRLHTLPAALLAVLPTTALALKSAWAATLLTADPATSPAVVAQGRHVALVVGACMLAAGVLRGALLLLDRLLSELAIVRHPARQSLRVAAGGAVAAIVVALALALGAYGVVHRQYEKFVNSNGGPQAHTRDRLTDVTNNGRLSLWKAAVRVARTQPIRGTGAGSYQLQYPRYRSEGLYVADAHSLYLQSLAELGVVGLVLMLVVVLGTLAGLASRIRGPDRGLYAALFAVSLAWALHQAFDWDWQMPAASLAVFMLAGLALARRKDRRSSRGGLPAGRTFVALGWLVLAIAPLFASISYARLHSAAQALHRGDCVTAKAQALSSLQLSARRPQAYVLIGLCDLKGGFSQAAVPAMAEAVRLEPGSWEGQFWLGVARAAAGVDPRVAIQRAVVLNPLEAGLRNAARRLHSSDPRQWERAAPRLSREALDSGKLALTSL
jgi:O-Antigen ligase